MTLPYTHSIYRNLSIHCTGALKHHAFVLADNESMGNACDCP